MLKLSIYLTIFFLSVLNIYADCKIHVYPDTLYFINNEADSLIISNYGNSSLKIDSIRNKYRYIYNATFIQNNDSYWFRIFCTKYYLIDSYTFTINPKDSILLLIDEPDLCPICKRNDLTYNFIDSLFIYSNDSTNTPVIIYSYGWGNQSGIRNNINLEDANYILYPNYPNPFNNNTIIRYSISKATLVKLIIYDINGRLVINLVDAFQSIGPKDIFWNGRNNIGLQVSSGIYNLILKVDNKILTRKIMYLK
jgi:hypothetical protein